MPESGRQLDRRSLKLLMFFSRSQLGCEWDVSRPIPELESFA
jgi:hypothetical protein